MTNHCPNSIKTRRLNLKKTRYGTDEFESYYLPAEEADAPARENLIPVITLPDGEPEGKPVIAVILGQDRTELRELPDYSIHPDYVEAVQLSGGTPVFISYEKIREQLEFWQPSGILLIGGDFAFPPCWFAEGDAPAPEVSRRAEAYLKICDYAADKHLPTLGICGGEQILAGYFGAKLRHSINAGKPQINHRQGGYRLVHEIMPISGSLLEKILGCGKIMTNSCHHEAVREDCPGDAIISARAADGTVEAVEFRHPWHPFVLGVQWHPERLVKLGDSQQLKLFEALIKESKNVSEKSG